jgi:hypothetical protein
VAQSEVLGKVPSDRVAAFVVWLPMLPGDSREAAARATALVGDKRARHFWDPDRNASRAFAKTLFADLGEANKPPKADRTAWDVYVVFGPTATWKDSAPAAAFWMHQLGGLDRELWLDGERLHRAVQEQLTKTAK